MNITQLKTRFEAEKNPEIAEGQKAYMRDKFEFLGIKTPLRRELQKPFFKNKDGEEKEVRKSVVKALWDEPYREYQYVAQEYFFRQKAHFQRDELDLIDHMVSQKSWWDTVDFIASKIASHYFIKFPDERDTAVEKWIAGENIWLIRTALLFQLHYKEDTDTHLLSKVIKSQIGSDEFFINKAIGWILRNYSRVNPDWVIAFAEQTNLHPLSRREGLRLLK